MSGEWDEGLQPDGGDGVGSEGGSAPAHLRAVSGPLDPPAADQVAPPVRLRREFKGLTVADLTRDEIVQRLPGTVQSALEHIERGDLAAAERVLPGHFAKVLEGPGHRRRQRWAAVAVMAVLAVVSAVALLTWLS